MLAGRSAVVSPTHDFVPWIVVVTVVLLNTTSEAVVPVPALLYFVILLHVATSFVGFVALSNATSTVRI